MDWDVRLQSKKGSHLMHVYIVLVIAILLDAKKITLSNNMPTIRFYIF